MVFIGDGSLSSIKVLVVSFPCLSLSLTSVSLSDYGNEDVGSSELVSCGVGSGVGGGVGALGGVEPRLVLVLNGEAHPLKADSEISQSGESSFSCCGPCLGRLVQSDSMSIVAEPELSSSIVCRTEVPLASITGLVSTPFSLSLVILTTCSFGLGLMVFKSWYSASNFR